MLNGSPIPQYPGTTAVKDLVRSDRPVTIRVVALENPKKAQKLSPALFSQQPGSVILH